MVTLYRTAPCLLHELLIDDPRPQVPGSRPQVVCNHVYTPVDKRSSAPSPEEWPQQGATWRTEALCQECRSHITLVVSYQQASPLPCPNRDYPLHHVKPTSSDSLEGSIHSFSYICSSPECKAEITAQARAPTLTPDDVAFLTSMSALQSRSKSVRERYPEMPDQQAIQSLATFRQYINNAISREEDRAIPSGNNFFMDALGQDAYELLTRLGFSPLMPSNGENQAITSWLPPKPSQYPDDTLRNRLVDVVDELTSLMQGRPDLEKRLITENLFRPPPGVPDMECSLGISHCKCSSSCSSSETWPTAFTCYVVMIVILSFSCQTAFCDAGRRI